MHDRPDVFISFASNDGEAFAEAVRVRLQRESPAIEIWKDHVSLEGGLKWWPQIQQAIDTVRFLVLIITPSVLHEELAPVVQKELRYARQQGVWIYPVMGASRDQIPFDKFPHWLKKLAKTTFYDFQATWSSPWDRPPLGHDYQFTHDWVRFVRQLDRQVRPPRVRNTAPNDLPANYVRREPEYRQLRALLLGGDLMSPIAITTSLHGPGGFGKTTLAKDLCRDPEIQEAFDDGILWVTLGEIPDVRGALAKLYNEVTGETAAFTDEEQAVQQLRPRLEDKDLLIVIDDVWSVDHVRPFLEVGKHAVKLFTTREMTVAAEARRGARSEGGPRVEGYEPWVTVDEPNAELAVEMLLRGLPDRPPSDQIPPYRELAVRRLGRWPLLIDLLASELFLMIEEGQSPEQALALINAGLDEAGLIAFEPAATAEETALRRERSARLTIDASLKRLNQDDRRHYEELAIFPEDALVPSTTLRALWGLSDFRTQHLARNLGRRSLLKFDARSKEIRLHDVFRVYLVHNIRDPSALHGRLVDGWGDLHSLPDRYAWRKVAHHLVQAGRRDRLRELLLDYHWVRSKLRATDPIALRDDAADFPDDPDLVYLTRAMVQSAHVLTRDSSMLRGQLFGRLLGIESVGIYSLLEQIGNAADEGQWLRPLGSGLTPADSPLLRVLEGRGGRVYAAAVIQDGRTAVSASYDGWVRLWDLFTGEVQIVKGCGGRVVALAVTPDGRTAVLGSRDGTVSVFDLAAGKLRSLVGHSGWVLAVAVTPDGRTVVSGSSDRALRVWDLATGEAQTLEGHDSEVLAVSVTADGLTVVSGSADGTVRVWNLASGHTRKLTADGRWVHAVSVTPDGRTAVTGSGNGTVWVWNLVTGELRSLDGHSGPVGAVAVTPDGRVAISGSDDRTVRVWDLGSGTVRRLEGHTAEVHAACVTPDGSTAVSGSYDGTVRAWDLRTGKARTLEGHDEAVIAVAVTAAGRSALSWSDDGMVRNWDLATGKTSTIRGRGGRVSPVAVTPDGRTAVSGSHDRTVRVWDLESGNVLTLVGHVGWVHAVAVTPDSHTAISASNDRTVRVWELATGEQRTLEVYGDAIHAMAVTPDGRTAVVGSYGGTVRMLDLWSGNAQTLESRRMARFSRQR